MREVSSTLIDAASFFADSVGIRVLERQDSERDDYEQARIVFIETVREGLFP